MRILTGLFLLLLVPELFADSVDTAPYDPSLPSTWQEFIEGIQVTVEQPVFPEYLQTVYGVTIYDGPFPGIAFQLQDWDHAFFLVSQPTTRATPEPGSLLLLMCGIIAWGACRGSHHCGNRRSLLRLRTTGRDTAERAGLSIAPSHPWRRYT